MQGLKGDATYLVVTDKGEIEKYGINGVPCTLTQSSGNAMAALFQSRILASRNPAVAPQKLLAVAQL